MEDIKFGGSHINFLDGLRGMAVLFVLLSHLSNNGWHILGANFAMSGKLGVWLFFVLSAFLLTSQFLRAHRSNYFGIKFVFSYLVARIFRIYPLYIIALLIAIYYAGWFDIERFWSMFFLESTSHHLWAIPVEFKFYFFLPLMFVFYVFVCREKLVLFVLPFVLFYLFFTSYGGGISIVSLSLGGHVSLWTHLPVFVIGFVVAVLHEREVYPSKGLTLAAWACVLVSIPSVTFFLFSLAGVELDHSMKRAVAFGYSKEFMMGIVWAIVLMGCYSMKPLRRIFAIKALVFTGKISFSLYLLHYFLFPVVREFDLLAWERGFLLLILSYFIAFVSYKIIEEFGIRQGKRVNSFLKLR